MKQALIIALMAPCAAFAQSTKTTASVDPCLPGITVAFSQMHMRQDCLAIDRNDTGTWTLRNKKPFVTVPGQKYAKSRFANDVFTAENVTLSTDGKQTLHADHFNYDIDEMKATLTGNVAVSTDGVEKKLGSYAVVDLSDNRCRIENLR